MQEDEESVGELLIDDSLSIRAAVEHLVKTGYQRIACIGAADVLSTGRNRPQAYSDVLKMQGLLIDEKLVCTGAPGYDMGKHSMIQDCTSNRASTSLTVATELIIRHSA